MQQDARAGFSLIDAIVSIGIVTVLIGGIYLVYFSILDTTTNLELRRTASAVLNERVETVRNIPYTQVGTVGGVPSGILAQQESVIRDGRTFTLQTTVRNIDDPFDGTVGGNPNDTAPADYKLVEFELSCTTCVRFVPVRLTTTVAPKNLESASQNGSLFVNVFDANGVGVAGADVRVVNDGVSPAIDFTDETNAQGILQLVDLPTSTQQYEISVSKSGYSSERTYAADEFGSSTPLKLHATVAAQTLTQVSFAIDRTSQLTVRSADAACSPVASQGFTMDGAKLLATAPDVLKFATSSVTGGTGTKTYSALEWDSYALAYTGTYGVAGTIPLSPFTLNPNTTQEFKFILEDAPESALLVTFQDAATGAGVTGATATLSKTGFSSERAAGHAFRTYTDWSGGAYSSVSGVETESPSGKVTMQRAGGFYSTSTVSTLVSTTFDVGGTPSQFYSLSWTPASQSGNGDVEFQVASNNDGTTWNYVGPDGTGNTQYGSPAPLHSSHTNHRYFRYKMFLSTNDALFTPEVRDVTIEFTGPCVPPSQLLWSGLSSGTYTLSVDAPGYATTTSSIPVSGAWQQTQVLLSP